MNRKSFVIGLMSYVIWGLLPAYWHALTGLNPLFILACRIVFSAVFCLILMKALGKTALLKQVFTNKQTMKYMAPAAVFITVNWGLYIYAMGSGHVLDSSFGYFIEPLIVSLFGIVLFRERCTKWQLLAFAFALAGVAYFGFKMGRLPLLSLALAVSFAVYSALKKGVNIDPVASIAVETIIVTPVSLIYIIYCLAAQKTGAAITAPQGVLLVLSGVVTAAPLILFASGVNNMPLYIMGFLQYISPTLQMLMGLAFGEKLSMTQLICFILIWVGFGIFSATLVKSSKKPLPA